MLKFIKPKESLTSSDIERGLRTLIVDGAFGQVMLVFTTGAFLIGFALELHASNLVIGVISAVGPLAQIIQLPSIYLVERLRLRKLQTVVAAFISRIAWVGIALLPWVDAGSWRIPIFLILLLVFFGVGNVAGCAYNSWLRDLVPVSAFNAFFSRRLAVATFAGAAISVLGAIAVDQSRDRLETPMVAYSAIFIVATCAGMGSIVYLLKTPEPTMPSERSGAIADMLRAPIRDPNFRQLLIFLGLWSLAVNFAAPFFAVYLLRDLGLTMTWVIALSVLSQAINVLFFRLWGRVSDRVGNKAVLTVSGPLFIISFLIWPFTTMPHTYVLTIPLVIAIHVLAGVSTAGVTLCAGNLAFKLAPYGRATAYLAVNALVSGVAATIAPILAGLAADYFAPYELRMSLTWLDWPNERIEWEVPTFDFRGLDFVFIIAFFLGIFSLHRLLSVKEEGNVEEAAIRQELLTEMRRAARQVSTVAGMRELIQFPYGTLKQWRIRRRGIEQDAAPPNVESG